MRKNITCGFVLLAGALAAALLLFGVALPASEYSPDRLMTQADVATLDPKCLPYGWEKMTMRQFNHAMMTNGESKVEWVGCPMVSDNDRYTPSQGCLLDIQIGLRDDGVVVWRKKPN